MKHHSLNDNHELIKRLEKLLAEAKQGKLHQFFWVAEGIFDGFPGVDTQAAICEHYPHAASFFGNIVRCCMSTATKAGVGIELVVKKASADEAATTH